MARTSSKLSHFGLPEFRQGGKGKVKNNPQDTGLLRAIAETLGLASPVEYFAEPSDLLEEGTTQYKISLVVGDAPPYETTITEEKKKASDFYPQHLGNNFWLYKGDAGFFSDKNSATNHFLHKVDVVEDNKPITTNTLRPERLSEFNGQDHIKTALETIIKSSNILNKPLPHILFSGGFGLGKTTLARAIGNELGTHVISVTASCLTVKEDIIKIFTNKKFQEAKYPILFIDEIHNLKQELAEQMYRAVDDYIFDTEDENGNPISMPVNPFTCIGATTDMGKLDLPYISRFEVFHLKPYSFEECEVIISYITGKLGIKIDEEAREYLAKVCRGVARTCVLLTNACFREMTVRCVGTINIQIVGKVLTDRGIDAEGFTYMDRKYMEFLNVVKRAGLGTLTKELMQYGGNKKTIEHIIEPYLLRKRKITFTPRGREILGGEIE